MNTSEKEKGSPADLLSLIPTIAGMLSDVPDYVYEQCRYRYGTYALNSMREFLYDEDGWFVTFPYEVKYVIVNEEETRDCPGSYEIEAQRIEVLNPVYAHYDDDEATVELSERELDLFAEELQKHLP